METSCVVPESNRLDNPRIRRAIISCSDKMGLVDFASGLIACGVQLYSTGGTRKHLADYGIETIDVSEYTGFPEMMDGRVKTLHPKIFGGILARRDHAGDLAAMQDEDIRGFELVVVNLYPFEATIARAGVTRAEAIEQIDIGGPSLIRAAAKNHQFVTVVTRPEQYRVVLEEIQAAEGTTSLSLRRRLAGEAFSMTCCYDQAIADYFRRESGGGDLPAHLTIRLERRGNCLRRESASAGGRLSPASRLGRQHCQRPPHPRQGAFVQQHSGPGQRADDRPRFFSGGSGGDQTQ